MPYAIALEDAHKLISEGKVKIEDIDRMVKSILRTYFTMKLNDRKKEPGYYDKFENHELVALQIAREGIVPLKNETNILPLKKDIKHILLTDDYVEELAVDGGAVRIEGYNNRLMLDVSKEKFNDSDVITLTFTVKNVGKKKGLEIAQLYVQDIESSVPRPVKELKEFQKLELEPGQSKTVSLGLDRKDFSFWNPETKGWFAEKGKFIIHIGSSSRNISLKKEVELL